MMNTTAKIDEVLRVINAEHPDPFSVLGMHHLESQNTIVVRAYLPNAQTIDVVPLSGGKRYKMDRIHENGF